MPETDLIPTDERVVLLSIRPEHADAILDGRKQFEFRRIAPAIDPPYTSLLYTTREVQAITGLIRVTKHIQNTAPDLARRTQTAVPQSAGRIAEYLQGGTNPTAMQVGTKAVIDQQTPREEIADIWEPGFTPQNFRYVGSDELLEVARDRIQKYLGGTTRRCRSYHTDPHCYRLARKDREPSEPTESELKFHEIDHCPNCNPNGSENNQPGEDPGESMAKVITPEEAD